VEKIKKFQNDYLGNVDKYEIERNEKNIINPFCEVPTAVLLRPQIVSDVTQSRCLGHLSP
jgi:hypothetical protein